MNFLGSHLVCPWFPPLYTSLELLCCRKGNVWTCIEGSFISFHYNTARDILSTSIMIDKLWKSSPLCVVMALSIIPTCWWNTWKSSKAFVLRRNMDPSTFGVYFGKVLIIIASDCSWEWQCKYSNNWQEPMHCCKWRHDMDGWGTSLNIFV